MSDLPTNQDVESDPEPPPWRLISFAEWLDCQAFQRSNELVDWEPVPRGDEFSRYQFYPGVEFLQTEPDGSITKIITWHLLPADERGNLRYITVTWFAEDGTEATALIIASSRGSFAREFFRRFVDLMSPNIGDHVGYGYFMIYSGTCKFYTYK